MMTRFSLYLMAAACALTPIMTNAATFRAETHSRGYVVYSTFDKPERCEVTLTFSFMREGKRDNGESLCLMKPVPEGKDVKFCEFAHERMVDPILSAPLKTNCLPPE